MPVFFGTWRFESSQPHLSGRHGLGARVRWIYCHMGSKYPKPPGRGASATRGAAPGRDACPRNDGLPQPRGATGVREL